jgi:hypothetical protein
MDISVTYISPLVLHLGVYSSWMHRQYVDVLPYVIKRRIQVNRRSEEERQSSTYVVVGLDDLFEDGLGVKDHGKLSSK